MASKYALGVGGSCRGWVASCGRRFLRQRRPLPLCLVPCCDGGGFALFEFVEGRFIVRAPESVTVLDLSVNLGDHGVVFLQGGDELAVATWKKLGLGLDLG